MTPADIDGVVALYGALSDDDRYLRFFSGYTPSRTFFERLVGVPDRGCYGRSALSLRPINDEIGAPRGSSGPWRFADGCH